MLASAFESYRQAIKSRHLSLVWHGYGSAIFLEIGELSTQQRRDGSDGNPKGEYTVMIEWSWRIESEAAILAGSWTDEQNWDEIFEPLVGRRIEDVVLFARLPELSITLEKGRYFTSFMTAEGQPAWTIFRNSRDDGKVSSISVVAGHVVEAFE
ncbi:hypothetical protein [Rhizobium tubonense]|uniref:Uncharacterized protein n=1 Tax=Rhizobium tubonense TaxID=484088 RepID=A0A2W4CNN7_9HYPH|nr:hypothetical protein [Rhizobium tubonense]PZM14407.1 hypothetical protein CPY51_11605 [Rhizobium tubonense]